MSNVKETVIQFGEGGFLRGFVDYFFQKLKDRGFEILSLEEGEDFSKTDTSNPVLVRIIASRGRKGEQEYGKTGN